MSLPEDRKLPEGRLGRFARLASVGVRTGASLLLDRDANASAKHAAEVLGTLRGLAAKVGQMASYVDGVIPEQHRDAYGAAMKGLQMAAPRSSSAEIRHLVEEELGAPIDRLFAEWHDDPIASASIGQVHRAVLEGGREVAVKAQHPGIVKALDSDLANAGILEGVIGVMGGRRLDSKSLLESIRARFREELDYELEASRAREFRAVHRGDPRVQVPEVIDDRSSKRVLTTEFVRGSTFDQACTASPTERTVWAETMWRFVFKGNLVAGMFNADPHPGNYLFNADGHVTFLDFGCVQPIEGHHLRYARKLHEAAMARDETAFADAVVAMIGAKPGGLKPLAIAYVRRCFQPLFSSPFRMTRPYAASLVEAMKDMAQVAHKLPDAELFTMPPQMVFMNRLQFGFYSVLARFDVDIDYAGVERGFWHEVKALPPEGIFRG